MASLDEGIESRPWASGQRGVHQPLPAPKDQAAGTSLDRGQGAGLGFEWEHVLFVPEKRGEGRTCCPGESPGERSRQGSGEATALPAVRPRAGQEEAQGSAEAALGGGRDRSRPSLSCPPRELLGGPQAWPLLLATCLVPGVLQLASLPLLPESPRYLLIDRGDPAACQAGEPLAWVPGPPLTMGHMWSGHASPFLTWEKLLLSLRPHFRLQPSLPRSLQGLS